MTLPVKLVEALGKLALPVVLFLVIANIVAVAGPVGIALFTDLESAVRHLIDLQTMR